MNDIDHDMTFDLTAHAYERLAAIRREASTSTMTKDNDMYQQQPSPNAYDEVMNRLGQAKAVNSRDPFVPPGAHDLIVASIEAFPDPKWGQSVRGTFEIDQSSNPASPPRSYVVKVWNLFKPSEFPNQPTDADDFVAFVCALQGIQLGDHHQACKALVKREAEGGQLERQPARGARIKAFGQYPKPGINPKTNKPYAYVKVQWQTVPQDMARIAQTRAELDQRRPLGAPTAAPTAQVAPQTGYNPQGVQYQPNGGGFVAAVTQAAPAWSGAPAYPPYAQPAPAVPGGYSAMIAPPAAQGYAPPATPAPAPTGKPPWNPAWGPMPVGY